MDNLELNSLWDDFQSGDLQAKNKLIEYYYPIVQKIAKKLAKKYNNKTSDVELCSYGVSGLFNAIERYDRNKKVSFNTFSFRRIQGSMIDELRKLDTVSRSVRLNSNKIEKLKEDLEHQKCRKILDYDIVETLNLQDFHKNYKRKYNPTIITSIDSNIKEDINENKKEFNVKLISNKETSPELFLMRKEFFKKLLKELNNLEKSIIYMYYYKNIKIKNIANKLNKSSAQISQIHKKVLNKIKETFNDDFEFFNESFIDIQKNCKKDSLF